MRSRRRWLMCSATSWLALGIALPARSQPVEGTQDVLKRGQAALAGEQPGEALALFEQGYREAAGADARRRFLFYRAVALQRQAEVEKKTGALNEAVGLYREYLVEDPQSGVALNNLARALEDLGQSKAAAETYEKAIALQDSRRPFYMQNYARALGKAGDWKASCAVYTSLVKEQPLAPGPHAAVMEYYLSADLTGLPGYLWELLDARQPERACLGALEGLGKRPASPGVSNQDYELLTIAVVGLSRMTYEPARLGDEEAGRKLRELSSGPDRPAACVKQILLLHERAGTPGDYGCWQYRDEPKAGAVSPGEGFQALIRGIGRWHRAWGDKARASGDTPAGKAAFDTAAQYFVLALDLNKGLDVDPVAFDELVRLEVGRDNLKAVAQLADAYQRSLLDSKAMAYAEKKDERIYQFHRALGEMYAVLGVWGSSSDVRSATFQLEHARDTSTRLEQRYGTKLPQEYRFSPEMTDLLARSYGKSGRPVEGWKLRLDQAERYQKAGDRDGAAEVLAPIRNSKPPVELKPRYDTILKGTEPETRRHPEVTTLQQPHVHRTKDLEIRFDVGKKSDRVPLTASQREQLYASLERFLERATASYPKVPAWTDAPAFVRSVVVDEKGQGVLVVDSERRPVELRFEVRAGRVRPITWNRRQARRAG